MRFSHNLTKLALSALFISPVFASSSTLKLVKEKLDVLNDHKLLVTSLGVATAYGVYKKSDTVRKKVDSSWESMKSSARARLAAYDKPITVGFWAKTVAALAGAHYGYNFDTTELKATAQKKYAQASGYMQDIYTQCCSLTREKQLALAAGIATALAATAVVSKKAISSIFTKDPKKAFLTFKASLSGDLVKDNTSILNKIEQNAQVLCTDEARVFLTQLDNNQYVLAEALLE